jgi:hypothetical protein
MTNRLDDELEEAFNNFTEAMKKRLLSKQEQGYSGWDRPYAYEIQERFILTAAEGVVKKNLKSFVDVANYALFLFEFYRRRKL